jgi:hypothetical protein
MRWKRREINLFKSRRRSFDRSSYDSFEKEREDWVFYWREKKKAILVNHEFYANVDVILTATRSEFKIFNKFVKHHEFIKRIVSSPQLVTRNVVTVNYVDAWVRWWMIFIKCYLKILYKYSSSIFTC